MVGLSILAFERNSGALAEFRINLDLLICADSFWCPNSLDWRLKQSARVTYTVELLTL